MSQLSANARALLERGRSALEPSLRDKERLRSVVLGSTPAAAGSAVTGAPWLELVVIALIGTAGGVGWFALHSPTNTAPSASLTHAAAIEPEPEPEPVLESGSGSGSEPESESGSESEPEPESAPARTPRPAPAPEPAPTPEPRPAPTLAPVLTLSDEVVVIARARAALRSGDHDAALEAVRDHAAKFPNGQLSQEAAVVRIRALCARGDRARASVQIEAFTESWPGSPYADRAVCANGETP